MNELIKKYVGKKCDIDNGLRGELLIGKIVEMNDNWIEVDTKKGKELVNSTFIKSIKIMN